MTTIPCLRQAHDTCGEGKLVSRVHNPPLTEVKGKNQRKQKLLPTNYKNQTESKPTRLEKVLYLVHFDTIVNIDTKIKF